MSVSFPGESAQYREARNRLLDQEAELRRAGTGTLLTWARSEGLDPLAI
jgi:hypothetical protein